MVVPKPAFVIITFLVLIICVLQISRATVARASQGNRPDLTKAEFYSVASCKQCHRDAAETPFGKKSTDFVRMDEYTIWSTKDKHALAYVLLQGPRGRRIGEILQIDVLKDPQCLNCHATTSRPDRQGPGYSMADGVSCDGCHGPAQHWMIEHSGIKPGIQWRLKTPQEKEELGMFDVRNPIKRAQMCMSCHIGNAAEGKVITHAMYAAGHPPLPSFELAGFSRNMPQHWYDARDVKFFKVAGAKVRQQNHADDANFQQTKLVLATSSESMHAMLELIANRASHDGKAREINAAWPPPWLRPFSKNLPNDRWPELSKAPKDPSTDELQSLWPEISMAQADCFACHHDLKSKSWRQLRGYSGKPGRPQFQPWPFALAPIALANDMEFFAKLQKLSAAYDTRLFGLPKAVAAGAIELMPLTQKMLQPTAIIDREMADRLFKALLVRGAETLLDYESARQVAFATQAIYDDLMRSRPANDDIAKLFALLDDELNLSPASSARKQPAQKRYSLIKALTASEKTFQSALKSSTCLDALQVISDDELRASLARVNTYDPVLFKQRMASLRRLLAPK